MYILMYVCMYVCTCTYACMRACMHVCTYVRTYVGIFLSFFMFFFFSLSLSPSLSVQLLKSNHQSPERKAGRASELWPAALSPATEALQAVSPLNLNSKLLHSKPPNPSPISP